MLRKQENILLITIVMIFVVIISCSCKENVSSDETIFNEKYKVEDDLISFWGYYQPTEKLDSLIDNPYLSEEDRERIVFAKKVAEEYPLIVGIDFRVHGNSYEDPNIVLEIELFLSEKSAHSYNEHWDSCFPDEIRDRYYLNNDDYTDTEIRNRIGVMWLNGEIDRLYSYEEFEETLSLLRKEIITDSSPNIPVASKCCIVSKESMEKWENVTKDQEWFQRVCDFSYESSDPSDSISPNNYRIYSLIYDYYMSHNPKLKESVGLYEYGQYIAKEDDATYDFFRLYKEYGEEILAPDKYDEIFSGYDMKIMDYFNITEEQMR